MCQYINLDIACITNAPNQSLNEAFSVQHTLIWSCSDLMFWFYTDKSNVLVWRQSWGINSLGHKNSVNAFILQFDAMDVDVSVAVVNSEKPEISCT